MKQKRQLAMLIALLVIAAAVWWSFFRRDQEAAPTEVAAAPHVPLLPVENPEIHWDALDRARHAEYKSSGRNIFSAVSLPAPGSHAGLADPPKIPRTPCGIESGPCPEPPPPPLTLPPNIKYFGYGASANGKSRRAFFTDGEEPYIVNEGQLLLNRYRILKIGNASVEFEEVSSGRRGTAPLEEQPGPSP